METDEPGLVRFWFEFDLTGRTNPAPPGVMRLDGDTPEANLLGNGVGVTGYDEADCLRLVARTLRAYGGGDLPPVTRVERRPVVTPGPRVGNPAWRGVWHPAVDRAGPVIG